MTKLVIVEHDEENMDQQTIEQGLHHLQRQGYSANQVGENIVVKDPVHRCGTGPNAGRLLLVGYADCKLNSNMAIMKFLSDRS